jgi:hypothetical protein
MPSHNKGSKGGFPIRRSSDQSSFAAPQGLSQRTTSFIASQRQGIHQMLLRHLIALMIDVRLGRSQTSTKEKTCFRARARKHCLPNTPGPSACGAEAGFLQGLGDPAKTECIPSLRFQTSAACLTHPRTSMTPDNTTTTGSGHRILVEPVGIEPTT